MSKIVLITGVSGIVTLSQKMTRLVILIKFDIP